MSEEHPVDVNATKDILSKVVKMIVTVDEAVQADSAGGKKIVMRETVDIVWNASKVALSYKEFPEVVEEVRNLSDEEKKIIADDFASEFNIHNDLVEEIVEKAITIILSIADIGAAVAKSKALKAA
jgi:hypothetical protein